MFGNIWKGLLGALSKPIYKKTEKVSEDVTVETEVSLQNVINRLEIVRHNLIQGSHEIVPLLQAFYVCKQCPLTLRPPHHLYLGDLIWKFTQNDDSYEFYRACDISIRGEYYVRREDKPLNKEWIEKEISKNSIVSVGVPHTNVPVRIIRIA